MLKFLRRLCHDFGQLLCVACHSIYVGNVFLCTSMCTCAVAAILDCWSVIYSKQRLVISVLCITFRASLTIEYTKAINIYGVWHAYYLIIGMFCNIFIQHSQSYLSLFYYVEQYIICLEKIAAKLLNNSFLPILTKTHLFGQNC